MYSFLQILMLASTALIGPAYAQDAARSGVNPDPPSAEVATARTSPFLEARTQLIVALGQASDAHRARAHLDMARFFLSHGLLHEARSALESAQTNSVAAEETALLEGLRTALTLLEGRPTSSSEALSMLEAAPFWEALQTLLDESGELSKAEFDAAGVALETQTLAFQRRAWPVLLEALLALESPDDQVIDAYSRAAHKAGMPEEQSLYLTGLMAQVAGEPSQAETFWGSISQGQSSWAARARLELASKWLSQFAPNYADARMLLERHLYTWRGDDLELQHLILLARIYEETGALAEAVAVMGRILSRFPESNAAALATQRAEALLPRLYSSGFAKELPFDAFYEHHLLNRRLFGNHPVFMPERLAMAHWLRDNGASDVAASEFAELADTTIVQARLAEAEALMDGGQNGEAWEALRRHVPAPDTEDAWRSLATRAAVRLDVAPENSPPIPAAPSSEDLRSAAALQLTKGDVAGGAKTLMRMASTHRGDVQSRDAVSLFLTSRSVNNEAQEEQAAQILSEQNATKDFAQSLIKPDRDFSTLRLTDTSNQLAQTQSVLSAVEALLNAPLEEPGEEYPEHSNEFQNPNPEQTNPPN